MKDFGFIGAGKMAGAIIHGIIASGAVVPSQIMCACGNDDTGKNLSKETSIGLAENLNELFADSKTIVVACKPQQLKEVAEAGADAKCQVLISILAGTSIARLRECFPNAKKIVRVMPNMPAQISQGISCYAPESPLSDDEKKIVNTVLSAIGEYMEVAEAQLDAVTALSGSGPGYIFEFAAAMIEGAKAIGFTEEEAKKLVERTLTGSAMLLEKSPLSADELRTAVSSPGGTTLAGLDVFAKNGLRDTVRNALIAARNRSQELSKL
ncbi:MAG: pyrroline-5-carboxylate reductase [Opitutales bacterium]|nr:pyrroline-5-carboxylate reductase [Opitutales bacterium]